MACEWASDSFIPISLLIALRDAPKLTKITYIRTDGFTRTTCALPLVVRQSCVLPKITMPSTVVHALSIE